jgi:predicted amidophosphoribosyltransferase
LIFLRDALDCSLALDLNLREPGVYTEIGRAEHDAKVSADRQAINYLSERCLSVVTKLGLYKECTAVCAVPPSPDKVWDLPTEIVRQVAAKSQKVDISSATRFQKIKQRIKSVALPDRWGALEIAELEVSKGVRGHRIVLIDDKYQSGTTIQFVASKLFQAGATEVLGLERFPAGLNRLVFFPRRWKSDS